MQLANVRQCIGSALIIYMIILGTYALFMFVTYMLYGDKKESANANNKVNNNNNSDSMNKLRSEEINVINFNMKNGGVNRNNINKEQENDVQIDKTKK